MNTPRAYRFRYPLRTAAGSVAIFFSGFLFVLPGMCGGPGYLGIEGDWAGYVGIVLFVLGLIGVVLGAGWFCAVVVIRGSRAGMKKLDAVDQNPHTT